MVTSWCAERQMPLVERLSLLISKYRLWTSKMINDYYRELLNKQQAYFCWQTKEIYDKPRVLWKCFQLSHVQRLFAVYIENYYFDVGWRCTQLTKDPRTLRQNPCTWKFFNGYTLFTPTPCRKFLLESQQFLGWPRNSSHLWNPEVRYRIHKCPPPVIPIHANPAHVPPPQTCFLKIHFNTLHSHLRLGFPSGSSLRFRH